MALTQEQIEQVIDYANQQILTLVENSNVDIENDKEVQHLYIMLNRLYKQLNTTLASQLPTAIYSNYLKGLQLAESTLKQAGAAALVTSNKAFKMLAEAPLHKEAISNIVSDTLDDLTAAFRTAERYGFKELDTALNIVRQELANGLISGMTTKQITKRVGQTFGNKGMTAFVTKDGKHLPLDFYAKTVTRTKMQTAQNHGHLNRYKERNVKYVYVTGNIPTCAHCASYRNIVFATERGTEFPYVNLYTTFPLHPNCKCNFRPWLMKFKSKEDIDREKDKAKSFNPGDDQRSKAEAKKYDAQQKAKQKARKQRLTYNKMKAQLGSDGPKSLREFKTASRRQYLEWVAKMKRMYS